MINPVARGLVARGAKTRHAGEVSFVDFGKRVLTCINTLVIDIKWATESGHEGKLFHICTNVQMLA